MLLRTVVSGSLPNEGLTSDAKTGDEFTAGLCIACRAGWLTGSRTSAAVILNDIN